MAGTEDIDIGTAGISGGLAALQFLTPRLVRLDIRMAKMAGH
jgi:hypothetical protein